MITPDTAGRTLQELIEKRTFSSAAWLTSRYASMKLDASPTEMGNIAEDFLVSMLQEAGYSDIDVMSGRRGDWDVKARSGDKEVAIEVKCATLDTNGAFQFNGIRHDTGYSHLFCLGILPNEVRYLLVPKEWLTTRRDEFKLASMAKGANSTFKLTRRADAMSSFSNFERDIGQYLGG